MHIHENATKHVRLLKILPGERFWKTVARVCTAFSFFCSGRAFTKMPHIIKCNTSDVFLVLSEKFVMSFPGNLHCGARVWARLGLVVLINAGQNKHCVRFLCRNCALNKSFNPRLRPGLDTGAAGPVTYLPHWPVRLNYVLRVFFRFFACSHSREKRLLTS